MPIIVDEVVITVDVSNHASGGAATPPVPTEARQAVVSECVERVLEILKQKEER